MLYHVIFAIYRLHHELHILGFFTPVQKPYSTPCIDMCTVRSSQYPPHIPINHPEWLGHSLLMTITFILSENPSLGFLLNIIPPQIIPPTFCLRYIIMHIILLRIVSVQDACIWVV